VGVGVGVDVGLGVGVGVCVCKLGLHGAGALPRRGINPQASAPSTARRCS
jgi:hypothetical protein